MKNQKLTTEEFIAKAKEIHGDKYDYSKVEYDGYYTKVVIICSKHGEFLQTPGNHLERRGCKKCQVENRSLTTKSFVEKAKQIHGDKYTYDKVDYTNAHVKVTITCPTHGNWDTRPNNFLHGNGCPKCRKKTEVSTNNKTVIKDTRSFIQEANKIHNNTYDYSKVNYINKRTKVLIGCSIHGDFEQTPDDHIHKPCGCPKCGHNVYTQEQFINKCNKIHNNKYIYEKAIYKSIRDSIVVICPEHGDFEINTAHHLKGAGCKQCTLKSQSKLFFQLTNEFNTENILFEVSNETVPWLDRQRLDIYFPKYNIAIEYDGKQHFEPIEIFGGTERFLQQQELDNRKNILCEKNNCKLFRVPYNYDENFFNNMCTEIKQIINS